MSVSTSTKRVFRLHESSAKTHRQPDRHLQVGGLTPFTATDFPGKLAAVVFVQGCPWRCGYCHNPHLQQRLPSSVLAWSDILQWLERRIGLIDAVVFSGGEPTMDPGLASAMEAVRALGFAIGLHTGGAYPRRLQEVLPLLDWVGMDIKCAFEAYETVTAIEDSGTAAQVSAQALLKNGVAYEFRTTVHPSILSSDQVEQLAQQLAGMGVSHYALQMFRQQGCNDPDWHAVSVSSYLDASRLERIAALFKHFTFRAA